MHKHMVGPAVLHTGKLNVFAVALCDFMGICLVLTVLFLLSCFTFIAMP